MSSKGTQRTPSTNAASNSNNKGGFDKNNLSFDAAQRKSNGVKTRALAEKSNLNKTFDEKNNSNDRSAEFAVDVTHDTKRKPMNTSFDKPTDNMYYMSKGIGKIEKSDKFRSQASTTVNEHGSTVSRDDPESYKEHTSKTSGVQSTAFPDSSRRNSSFKADSLKMPMLNTRNGAHYPYGTDGKATRHSKSPNEARNRQYRSEGKNQQQLPDIMQNTLENKKTIEDGNNHYINPTPYSNYTTAFQRPIKTKLKIITR